MKDKKEKKKDLKKITIGRTLEGFLVLIGSELCFSKFELSFFVRQFLQEAILFFLLQIANDGSHTVSLFEKVLDDVSCNVARAAFEDKERKSNVSESFLQESSKKKKKKSQNDKNTSYPNESALRDVFVHL
jgi:hypothetical protein